MSRSGMPAGGWVGSGHVVWPQLARGARTAAPEADGLGFLRCIQHHSTACTIQGLPPAAAFTPRSDQQAPQRLQLPARTCWLPHRICFCRRCRCLLQPLLLLTCIRQRHHGGIYARTARATICLHHLHAHIHLWGGGQGGTSFWGVAASRCRHYTPLLPPVAPSPLSAACACPPGCAAAAPGRWSARACSGWRGSALCSAGPPCRDHAAGLQITKGHAIEAQDKECVRGFSCQAVRPRPAARAPAPVLNDAIAHSHFTMPRS